MGKSRWPVKGPDATRTRQQLLSTHGGVAGGSTIWATRLKLLYFI